MTPPAELRCEHSINPLGLDVARPRFSWRVVTERKGAAQSGYRILVATTPGRLARNEADLWDSGRVESAESSGVRYAGRALQSRQQAHWKVLVWDEAGVESGFSSPANFEMALLDPKDWTASWIGSLGSAYGGARYFRCRFTVAAPVVKARLYVTGLGYHEMSINGHRLGESVLDPAYTDTTKRVLYVTHDATPALRAGENVLSAVVGPGWHGAPILLGQLEIDLEDGGRQIVATTREKGAPSWSVASGPIVSASVFDGETYDARLEKTGWELPAYDERSVAERSEAWAQVFAVRGPAGRLQAQPVEPIRMVGELAALSVTEVGPGLHVFDFGQNHAGWVRLKVEGPRGTSIRLRYAEVLAAGGRVNQDNLRTAKATDVYILKGGAQEIWTPRFTYHGYRYVEVEGWPGTPTRSSLMACVVRSGVARRGEFSCDHDLLNRIHAMVRWTEESNLHGIPTDCPQRDERMGWLNDLAARTEELVYNFEATRLLEKFVGDIADTQDPATGAVSDTAPFHWGRRPADPVSACYLLIPWLLHTHAGDHEILERHYEGLRRWVDFLSSRSEQGIVRYSYYGDWAPPKGEAVTGSIGSGAISAKTPGELISTAYYFYAADLLAKIAGVLGKADDAHRYRSLGDDIRTAFHRLFWCEELEGYGSGNQACNAIALYLRLVPEELRERVVNALVRDVARHDYHLTTGNLCTKYLLEVLSAEGHAEAAMAIATQTGYPSWGHMLGQGATTVWERWELMTGDGMNSHNHPMMGSVGAWLYRWVAGLALEPPRAGKPHFVIQPPLVGAVTRASASLPTPWGRAGVVWERKDRRLKVEAKVPWNCTATIRLPDGARHEVGAGTYVFAMEREEETWSTRP